MLRYLSIATLFAIVVAAAAYLLGAWSPLLPSPLVAAILFVCPSHSFFAATAACEPFDACSLNMLAWVILANIVLYCHDHSCQGPLAALSDFSINEFCATQRLMPEDGEERIEPRRCVDGREILPGNLRTCCRARRQLLLQERERLQCCQGLIL